MRAKSTSNNVKYILELSTLKNGDIVLSRSNNPISFTIQMMTDGAYSHAMIYYDQSLLEATLSGVFATNPQRLIVDTESDLCVLRLIQDVDKETINSIETYIRTEVGNDYTITEARKVPFESEHTLATSKQFCSRLVARGYASVGINIVDNPDFCSPNDLLHSPLLDKVLNFCRLANNAEIAFANSNNPVALNQARMNDWLIPAKKIAKNTGFKIDTFKDVFTFVTKYPKYADKIASLVVESNYLKTIDTIILQDHKMYNSMSQSIATGQLSNEKNQITFISDVENFYKNTLNQFNKAFADFIALQTYPKNQFVELFISHSLNMMEFCVVRMGCMLSIAGDSGLNFKIEEGVFPDIFMKCNELYSTCSQLINDKKPSSPDPLEDLFL